MPKFAKDEFSTVFLWKLITDEQKRIICDSFAVDTLFRVMFPGIKLSYIYKFDFLVNHCIPALRCQFQELGISSLETIKNKYGKTLKVDKVRNCDGYEWVNWDTSPQSP